MSKMRKLVLVALLVALALSTNYLLISIPNIKLMDFVTFFAGKNLGLTWGLITAILIWLVYGTINPYGFSSIVLPVVTFAQFSYCIAGSLIDSKVENKSKKEKFLIYGIIGLISTLVYDLITNSIVGILFYGSLLLGLLTMNFPIPMGILHEFSNAIIFPTFSIALEPFMKKSLEV